MIIAFTGLPGGGKSCAAVARILDNLKLGKRVYTNIEGLDQDEQRQYIKVYCDLDDYHLDKNLIFMSEGESTRFFEFAKENSLIVLDEAHLLFSNREWDTKKNNEFAKWASTHRHHGFNVLIITQSIEKIEKHVRSLIQWNYVYKKIDYLGSLVQNGFHESVYSGCEVTGKALKVTTRKYDKSIFNCYKSTVNEDIKREGFMPTTNILKHPVFYAIPVLFCGFLYMFFAKSSFATGDPFGSKKMMDRATTAAVQNASDSKKPSQPFTNISISHQFPSAVPPLNLEQNSIPVLESVPMPLPPPLPEAAVVVKAYVMIGENEYIVSMSDGDIIRTKYKPKVNRAL